MYKVPILTITRERGSAEGRRGGRQGGVSGSDSGMSRADRRVNLTPDGKEALLKLSRGDMRRALNVLQVSRGMR